MIICYHGGIRTGKTLSAVRELYKLYLHGYTIYSNIHLNFPHKRIDVNFLMDIVEDKVEIPEKKPVMFFDEIHVNLADSRLSMGKRNRIVSYFLLQSGKMGEDSDFGMTFFYTTQFLHQIDKRLRSLTMIFTECEKYTINGRKIFVNTTFNSKGRKSNVTVTSYFGEPYYQLYDTREVVKYTKDTRESET